MERVAILGLGLMGGSLGLALKAACPATHVTGYARRQAARDLALERGACDEVFDDPRKAVRDADLSVLALPIRAIPEMVNTCKPSLKAGSLLTDVGSTKKMLNDTIGPALEGSGAIFIGSHPMAGSELQGLDAARADLYREAVVAVTPDASSPADAVERLAAFWKKIGAIVRIMPPEEHDRLVARTSHLPHVAAVLLAATVSRDPADPDVAPMCATGFMDTTRIADGSPEVWRDILETNGRFIAEELRSFQGELADFLAMLEREDFGAVAEFLVECRDRRRTLLEAGCGSQEGERS